MTELWLVRHGQTDWNLANIVQGHSDIPLNDTGLAQARELADRLNGTHFDALYCSDLIRARQTGAILAESLNLEVVIEPRIREIRQGVWEGFAIPEIIKMYPEEFKRKNENPLVPAADGAESVAEVVRRMVGVTNELRERHPDQRLLLVTHGFAIAALTCVVRGIPIQEVAGYIPDNGTPVVLSISDALQVPDF